VDCQQMRSNPGRATRECPLTALEQKRTEISNDSRRRRSACLLACLLHDVRKRANATLRERDVMCSTGKPTSSDYCTSANEDANVASRALACSHSFCAGARALQKYTRTRVHLRAQAPMETPRESIRVRLAANAADKSIDFMHASVKCGAQA
jgi:hypothetical protein